MLACCDTSNGGGWMLSYIFLSILVGVLFALSRSVNGMLAQYRSTLMVSVCNHLVGFLFLSLFFILASKSSLSLQHVDYVYYICGVFGAIFVCLNSYVVHRIGATSTIIIVTAGQLIASLVIEYHGFEHSLKSLVGVAIIICSVFLKECWCDIAVK